MFKTFITTVFSLLLFLQNGTSQEECSDLIKTLYPNPKELTEEIQIKSESKTFFLGEPITLTTLKIIDFSAPEPIVTESVVTIDFGEESKIYIELKIGSIDLLDQLNYSNLDLDPNLIVVEPPEYLKHALSEAEHWRWLLPNEDYISIKSCDGFQSYREILKGYQVTLETKSQLVLEKGEEIHVIFDSDKSEAAIVKGFYTSSSLVLVDDYVKDKGNNMPISFRTSKFYLDNEKPVLIGQGIFSTTIQKPLWY